MPDIFQSTPGTVLSLDDPSAQAVLPLFTSDPSITFQEQKSLVTRIVIAQETNYQFMHALGGNIYIYVFGDRVGQMTISGLSFARECPLDDDGKHGFEKILAWYKANKISARKTPITMAIGHTALTGFVVGMTGSVFDHTLYLMEYSISIMLLPDK